MPDKKTNCGAAKGSVWWRVGVACGNASCQNCARAKAMACCPGCGKKICAGCVGKGNPGNTH